MTKLVFAPNEYSYLLIISDASMVFVLTDVFKQLATSYVLHHEEDPVGGSEGVLQAYQKRMPKIM